MAMPKFAKWLLIWILGSWGLLLILDVVFRAVFAK